MTTTTTRRTTKITQPARGYTAIQCDYVSAATARIACVAKEAMHIEGISGASVDLKAGEAFWLVRSESLGDNWFYIVREVVGEKRCSCPANKPCKHEVSTKAHIVAQGRPAIHLRAREIAAEASKAKAAQAATRETRVALVGGYHYEPQYLVDGKWQSLKDEEGKVISFIDEMNKDLAYRFIAEDSDEHRSSVLAEYQQRIEEYEATQRKAETGRDLVAVAAANAAKAGPAIDKALIASTAASVKRTSAPLNGNRAGYLLPTSITAPVIAASRLPMR